MVRPRSNSMPLPLTDRPAQPRRRASEADASGPGAIQVRAGTDFPLQWPGTLTSGLARLVQAQVGVLLLDCVGPVASIVASYSGPGVIDTKTASLAMSVLPLVPAQVLARMQRCDTSKTEGVVYVGTRDKGPGVQGWCTGWAYRTEDVMGEGAIGMRVLFEGRVPDEVGLDPSRMHHQNGWILYDHPFGRPVWRETKAPIGPSLRSPSLMDLRAMKGQTVCLAVETENYSPKVLVTLEDMAQLAPTEDDDTPLSLTVQANFDPRDCPALGLTAALWNASLLHDVQPQEGGKFTWRCTVSSEDLEDVVGFNPFSQPAGSDGPGALRSAQGQDMLRVAGHHVMAVGYEDVDGDEGTTRLALVFCDGEDPDDALKRASYQQEEPKAAGIDPPPGEPGWRPEGFVYRIPIKPAQQALEKQQEKETSFPELQALAGKNQYVRIGTGTQKLELIKCEVDERTGIQFIRVRGPSDWPGTRITADPVEGREGAESDFLIAFLGCRVYLDKPVETKAGPVGAAAGLAPKDTKHGAVHGTGEELRPDGTPLQGKDFGGMAEGQPLFYKDGDDWKPVEFAAHAGSSGPVTVSVDDGVLSPQNSGGGWRVEGRLHFAADPAQLCKPQAAPSAKPSQAAWDPEAA